MISLSHTVHNTVASISRRVPRIRGKGRIGGVVSKVLGVNQVMTVRMRDGSRMRLDPRSETESPAIWTGDYEGRLIGRVARCLQAGDVALDIGANVGFWTVPLARALSAGGGKLFAFEPIPSNFQRLNENVQLNGLSATVQCLRTALADEEGTLELATDQRNGASTGNAVIVRDGVSAHMTATDSAPVARLDRLATELRIDRCRLIKIDIEGAEAMAFRGGLELVRRCRPIIYGEFNPFWMQQFGHSFLDIAEIFKPLDYVMFRSEANEFTLVSHAAEGLCDMLLAPCETPASVLKSMGVRGEGASKP